MIRRTTTPRADLTKIIEKSGFAFAQNDGIHYWNESAYYSFSLRQIEDHIEKATSEVWALCLELVERAVTDEAVFDRLCLPKPLQDLARDSWKRGDKTLYGRFDLSYNGDDPPKLLEFNADTPTSLFEAAVFQWSWLEDEIESGVLPQDADQFNSIHDCLIAIWPRLARHRIHFAALQDIEDEVTVQYLAQTAKSAGLDAITLSIDQVGDTGARFVDSDSRPIDTLFKLYPWEWMIQDEFGRSKSLNATTFLEPAWKAILSTKAILPLLWEIAPLHPNLVPARFSDDPRGPDLGGTFVRKPCRSREGANITVVEDHVELEATGGNYEGPNVDQSLVKLPNFDGNRPVIGSWLIGDKSCGIGIREGRGEVTTNQSSFVPHVILD